MPEINSPSAQDLDPTLNDQYLQQMIDEGIIPASPSKDLHDSLSKSNASKELPPGYMIVDGQPVFQTLPTSASSPQLTVPQMYTKLMNEYSNTLTGNTTEGEVSTTVMNDSLQDVNIFLNSTSLTLLTAALELLALSIQKQKLIDKQNELKLNDLSYKTTLESAALTIQLGQLEQQEHLWKGVAIMAAGIASGGAAFMLPRSGNSTAAASTLVLFEISRGIANAASEFVSAGYAVPKATLQALKQIKDQVIQLLSANRESSAQLAKEDQDSLDRLIQSISDMIQKLKQMGQVAN